MRPFRLGRCVFLLASRPQCCQPQRLAYDTRLISSARALQETLTAEVEPLKRKRGRPRKVSATEPLQANVVAIGEAPSVEVEIHPVITAALSQPTIPQSEDAELGSRPDRTVADPLEFLPSPPPSAALSSAKLSALHARLSLPSRLPIQSLARTLIHPTADPDIRFNNSSLATLGSDLLGQHMAEHLIAKHPRLPMAVVYAAQNAFVGSQACTSIVEGWGVEAVAEPGGEVDPGLLQFRRAPPGAPTQEVIQPTRMNTYRKGHDVHYRRGMSSRTVYDDQFGEEQNKPGITATPGITDIMTASADFFRALVASIYLHAGSEAAYSFFKNHVLSRHLDIATLFTFTHPTRDLSRLCAREGFEAPLARILSETGRLSRHPVFVVGVYSGNDELGQGVGASLNEARFKASISALKGWYLYSPPEEAVVPSQAEKEVKRGRQWKPLMVDCGEIIM